MNRARKLAGACVALAVLALAGRGSGQETPPADGWIAFEGTWSAAGRKHSVPVEGGGTAVVLEFSGAVSLEHGEGLTRGFRGEAIAFDDGKGLSVGRAAWTDARGESVFSRLVGEPLVTGRRIVATITGGTGRYAGAEGEYSFYWRYVVSSEEGVVEGRAVNLKGRIRLKSAAR